MSQDSHPDQRECSQTPLYNSSDSSITTENLYYTGYQQALHDFAIHSLLNRIETCSDSSFDADWVALTSHEAEAIAAIFIQTLVKTLDGSFLATYLDAIRSKTCDISNSLPSLQIPMPTTELPATFPDVEIPQFLYGDRLCWISNHETTDSGIVIGRFYNFAPHLARWQWSYLIWLDSDSPSSAWVRIDVAWEDDLQPYNPTSVSSLDG